MHSPLPEQSEFFWQASRPLEQDAWQVAPPCPESPMQHLLPLPQLDELLHVAPDAAPPSPAPARLALPPAGDMGHDVEEN